MDNIKEVAEAGVDMFVAGSAILKAPRTQDAYRSAPPHLPAPPARAGSNGLEGVRRRVGCVSCAGGAGAPAGDGLP